MRTRRAFRPQLESMPFRDLPSSVIPTDPMAPVTVPSQPRPNYVQPTSPTQVNPPAAQDEPYTGPDTPPPTNPDDGANC